MTTDEITTSDPAAVTDAGSTMLVQNVFQRLLTAPPGKTTLKPDAAEDCRFQSRKVYRCVLNDHATFSNGKRVTTKDVKFSIERAIRLDKSGSSAGLLSTLRRVKTPDAKTIKFILTRYDTQFPWALAAPAASIVAAKAYNPHHVQAGNKPVLGSGPYKVAKLSDDELDLVKNQRYKTPEDPQVRRAVIKTMPDSGSIEEAMKAHHVDVVWRGLSSAAQQRLHDQIETSSKDTSKEGFSQTTLHGARVQQLEWNPDARYRGSKAVRTAVTRALQNDRTLDSVVPRRVTGHKSSFPAGGKSTVRTSWDKRRRLTLGYDSAAPDSTDLATRIRSRLEETGGFTVALKADDRDADLRLLDRKAWTSTGIGWLQPILEHPLKAYADKIKKVEWKARKSGDRTSSMNSALATLQRIAAQEKVLLPISQKAEHVYSGKDVSVSAKDFGPGWQLGLWGMQVNR